MKRTIPFMCRRRCVDARFRRLGPGAAAAASAGLFATPVLAQATVKVTDESGGILPWAIALGMLILVCAVAFMNSKRSHLD